MKRFYTAGGFFIALLFITVLPCTNCHAAEIESVEGRSFLTFLHIGHSGSLGILSFEEDGTFNMFLLGEETEGTGTYKDFEQLFSAEWTSDDGNSTYTFMGLSIVRILIVGTGEKIVAAGDNEDNADIRFLGIWSELIPD